MSGSWRENKNSTTLEAKFLFENYTALRDFLDDVASITEDANLYPNISFGRDFASLIIYAAGDNLSAEEYKLAEDIQRVYKK
jgi:pterin-4a-carbinolamine dehydratase